MSAPIAPFSRLSQGKPTRRTPSQGEAAEVASESADLPSLLYEYQGFMTTAVLRLAGPSLDTSDLVQQIFATALEQWPKSRPIRSHRTWLYGIALHVVARARRRERLRRAFSAVTFSSELMESPEVTFEAKESLRIVYQALDRMPEKLRFAWILSEIEGVPGLEMADILNLSPTAARSRLFRARKMFEHLFARFAPRSDRKRTP